MVNSVVEYAVRLLKEFDRNKLEFTGNLRQWTRMWLRLQQFYTRHLLLWSSTLVTCAAGAVQAGTVVLMPRERRHGVADSSH